MEKLDLENAKRILCAEVNCPHADNHSPFSNKYSRRKIIGYLWAYDIAKNGRSGCIDWLKDLYTNAGMTEEEMLCFVLDLELAVETIERKPKI